MSHTWRSPCSGPLVCRLFAPGGERERERERGGRKGERWGWVDKENTIGLFYCGRSTVKSSCASPGPAQTVTRGPGGACPSHGGKNGWNSAHPAPREPGLHKITARPVPSVLQDKDPRGKHGILCHCAEPMPFVWQTHVKKSLSFLTGNGNYVPRGRREKEGVAMMFAQHLKSSLGKRDGRRCWASEGRGP